MNTREMIVRSLFMFLACLLIVAIVLSFRPSVLWVLLLGAFLGGGSQILAGWVARLDVSGQ